MCLEEAPNLITHNRDETAVHFFKQPETPEEIEAAERAIEVCPTLAIGNNGWTFATVTDRRYKTFYD